MRVLFDIQDMLEDELKKISKKDDITSSDLDNVYKIVDIVKDISTIEAMKNADQNGYSRDYSMDYGNSYTRDGYSERRGRDSMGRYTSRDSEYSRHGNKDRMIEDLKVMMQNARTEDERNSYRKAVEQLER